MAVQKIEYAQKAPFQTNENVPTENQCTADNMNEIKSKVNNNADELTTAQQNIEDLQEGQGTASSDITNLKNRVTTLEGDNTKNKQDIANKVDKVEGKGLSTEDYTTAEKQKLAGLNNYDDTEIKQDIQDLKDDVSDIKAEQQEQNDLLQRTQNALINITTPKSSNINVKDSSDLNAKVDVYGISEQETREGYNLLNVPEELEISIFKEITVNLKANTTYTLKFENAIAGADNNQSLITFRNTADVISRIIDTSTTKKITVQPEQEITNIRIYASTDYTSSTGKTKTFEKLMLYEGTEDKDYEQYGASPSPEYPSNIENVEGNVDITVCNKNLFDKNKITDNNYLNENGRLTANTLYCVSDFINVVENETYFLPTRGTSRTKFYNKNKQALTDTWDVADGDKNFVIPANAKYIRFSINKKTVNIDTFQFERNSIETDYIENQQQTITFPLQEGQKLYEGSYLADDGIRHKRKQIELDGSEDWIFYASSAVKFGLTISNMKFPVLQSEILEALSNQYKAYNWSEVGQSEEHYLIASPSLNGTNEILRIKNTDYTDLASFKNYLAQQKEAGTPVIIEFALKEEEIEPYTEKQQEAYDKLQNVLPYKLVTNIFTDKALLEFKYIADTQTWVINEIKPLKEQINTINELLSTTATSALLLNNMQTDLESEVV